MKIPALDLTHRTNYLPAPAPGKREAKHLRQATTATELRELRKQVAHLQSSVDILGQLFAQINLDFEALKKRAT